MAEQRSDWPRITGRFERGRLWFLDETGAKTNMTLPYARSFDGGRIVDKAPHGHWQTTTLVGALGLSGAGPCMILDGPLDSVAFQVYIDQFLCPSLRPGDIVIMDNLSSHLGAQVGRAIDARDARMQLLPPYSPDFNPIEKMWSKIKQHLKKTKARSHPALIEAISCALKTVTPADARAWFASCGYAN